jgi:hypothetical protein
VNTITIREFTNDIDAWDWATAEYNSVYYTEDRHDIILDVRQLSSGIWRASITVEPAQLELF